MGNHPAKRPVLGFKVGGGSAGVVGSTVRLHARAAHTPLAVGAAEEGGGPDAVRVSVARTVGVAQTRTAASPPAKCRRVCPKVPKAEGSSSPSLADLARLAARSRGLVRPPPPPVIPCVVMTMRL